MPNKNVLLIVTFLCALTIHANYCFAARYLSEPPAQMNMTEFATSLPAGIPDISTLPKLDNMKLPDFTFPPMPSPKLPNFYNITILGVQLHIPFKLLFGNNTS